MSYSSVTFPIVCSVTFIYFQSRSSLYSRNSEICQYSGLGLRNKRHPKANVGSHRLFSRDVIPRQASRVKRSCGVSTVPIQETNAQQTLSSAAQHSGRQASAKQLHSVAYQTNYAFISRITHMIIGMGSRYTEMDPRWFQTHFSPKRTTMGNLQLSGKVIIQLRPRVPTNLMF